MSSSNAVDVSSSDKKLWLVKFPPMVAQRLHAMAGQGAIAGDAAGKPIGRVRVTQIATQTSSEFKLQLDPGEFPNIPKEFNMRPHADGVQDAYCFSHQGSGCIGVEGRVDQRFDVEMQRAAQGGLDPQYRSLARDRSQAAGRKTRVMQVIDDPRNLLLRPMPVGYMKRKTEKATDNKRLRMEGDALENMLFGLFEKQTTWSFVQLQRETDQPAPWLKEVLNGVAILNKTGPNRDKWQLPVEPCTPADVDRAVFTVVTVHNKMGLPELKTRFEETPVRICGFPETSRASDAVPASPCYSSFSEDHSPSRLKVPASPLSAALREAQRKALVSKPPGLRSLNIGKSRAFAHNGMRKSSSMQQLALLAEEQETQPLNMRSGSCSVLHPKSVSPSGSNPISIPTPRAPSSGRAASSSSMAGSFVEEYKQAGLDPIRQLQKHPWQSSPQEHSQVGAQPEGQPQPPNDSAAGEAAEPPPQRVPSPCGVLPDEPGAVFVLEPASLPRLGSGRMCSDTRSRSQSAAVLSAYG